MSIAPKRSREVFQNLERDLVKLASQPQAKTVHRFRTGTRRLQILLSELSPKLDRSDKKLLKQLGRIRKRAGKVRDLDMQAAALRSLKVPREPRRKSQLVNHLIELRSQQEKKLRKQMDKTTVREIRKRLKRAAKHFRPEAGRDPLAVARAMLDALHRTGAPLTETVLHQYRILSKRVRYAAEFAIPSPASGHFITQIKQIQDALGDWHDWLTLTQTATAHLGDVRESPLVAELHNVTGAKYRRAVAILSQIGSAAAPVSDQPTRRPLAAPAAATANTASAA
ncbi:MAG TPA: CHAD domain-containing protein [Candidatus Deferrimicrobiaceae bacterium]|jgi:CHAD domain-containing protein|nr:CHAD domain-containing protein [Candidatus Deferrimicrobiaceae bacterium]